MTMMTTAFSSLGGIRSQQASRSVWRQFLDSMSDACTPRVEDEIAHYLARHRHDLPPQVYIELERRRFGS
jgi:hypothetical protein